MDRRSFFRQMMLRGLNRAQEVTDKVGQRYQSLERTLSDTPAKPQSSATQASPAAPPSASAKIQPPVQRYLRPPGALAEAAFVDKCTRCGACVRACPALAIVIDDQHAAGRPYILPRANPCVMCNDVACTHACPSGALTPIATPGEIRIGKAKIDTSRCLRTPAQTVSRGGSLQAEDCTLCVTQCPAGSAALAINDQGDLEVRDACTGCGVCEQACPTEPASIYVIPNLSRT
jgi:ferredoxin-type protein NapG